MFANLSRFFAQKAEQTAGSTNEHGYRFLSSWLTEYPARLSSSKAEFRQVFDKVKKGDVTVNEAVNGTVYFAGYFGLFFLIGEMIGKGSVFGYQVGARPGSDHGEKH